MRISAGLLLAATFLLTAPLRSEEPPSPSWTISGQLAEACTCNVPCTCEFGQGPSPGKGCRSVITLTIDRGELGNVSVAGRKFAIIFGDKGAAAWLDAAPGSREHEALRTIVSEIARKSGFELASIADASIEQKCDPSSTVVRVGEAGGFDAEMLVGFDGKSPVIVENNGDVNVPRLEKGKTKSLDYRDAAGNSIHAAGSNSSRGHFDWSDKTVRFF